MEQELVILTKGTLDKFLQYECAADLIALYVFYYYTAKWQKTNQPKAVDKYVKAGLHWGDKRFTEAKKILTDLELITQVVTRDTSGKVKGYYIKLNYIISKENEPLSQSPQKLVLDTAGTGFQETNALSTNNINALSDSNINTLTGGSKKPKKERTPEEEFDLAATNTVFTELAKIYPGVNVMRGWKPQREAAAGLVRSYGIEEVRRIIQGIPKIIRDAEDKRFIPNFSTPTKLLENFPKAKTMLHSDVETKIFKL